MDMSILSQVVHITQNDFDAGIEFILVRVNLYEIQ